MWNTFRLQFSRPSAQEAEKNVLEFADDCIYKIVLVSLLFKVCLHEQ
jgi:hypothetical protein